MSGNRVCFKCGSRIEEGRPFFITEMKITSGFDGCINESLPSDKIGELLHAVEMKGSLAAEEEVFKELRIVLCKKCKDILIKFLAEGNTSTANDSNCH